MRRGRGRRGRKKHAGDPLWLKDIKNQWQRDRASQVDDASSGAAPSAAPARVPATSGRPPRSPQHGRRGTNTTRSASGSSSGGSSGSSGDLSSSASAAVRSSMQSTSGGTRKPKKHKNAFLALLQAGSAGDGDFFNRFIGSRQASKMRPAQAERTPSDDQERLEELYGGQVPVDDDPDSLDSVLTSVDRKQSHGNVEMRNHIRRFMDAEIDRKKSEAEAEQRGVGVAVGIDEEEFEGEMETRKVVTRTESGSEVVTTVVAPKKSTGGGGTSGTGSGGGTEFGAGLMGLKKESSYPTLRRATLRPDDETEADGEGGAGAVPGVPVGGSVSQVEIITVAPASMAPSDTPAGPRHQPSQSSPSIMSNAAAAMVDPSGAGEEGDDGHSSPAHGGHQRQTTYSPHQFASLDRRDQSRPDSKLETSSFTAVFTRKAATGATPGTSRTPKKPMEDPTSLRSEMRRKKKSIFRPLSALIERAVKKKRKKKRRENLGPQLRKYLRTCGSSMKHSNSQIALLERKIVDLRHQVPKDMDAFSKRALWQLRDCYLPYTIHKIIRLEQRVCFEKACRQLVKRRHVFSKHASNLLASGVDPPGYICDKFFLELDDVAVGDTKLNWEWGKVVALVDQEKKLEKKYDFRRRTTKFRNTKESEAFLKRFLPDVLPVYGTMDFESVWQDEVEDKFSTILGDVRTGIGQSIVGFLGEIQQHGMENILPKEYIAYIDSVIDCLKTAYTIDDPDDIKKLRFLNDRYIFQIIGEKLYNIIARKEAEADENFNDNLRLLRHLSPNQVGVRPCYLHPVRIRFSFLEAIDLLRSIPYCIDPNVMMHAVRCACSLIGAEAKKNCLRNGVEWSFGADDFFPILIYCIVQANEANIPSHMKYVSSYATLYKHEEHSSEVNYFRDVMGGATNYIASMTMEQLMVLLREKNEVFKLRDYATSHVTVDEWDRLEGLLDSSLCHISAALTHCQDYEIPVGEENDEHFRERLIKRFETEREAAEAALVTQCADRVGIGTGRRPRPISSSSSLDSEEFSDDTQDPASMMLEDGSEEDEEESIDDICADALRSSHVPVEGLTVLQGVLRTDQ